MWQGEGWIETRRKLGVLGLSVMFVAEIGLGVAVPIGLYGMVSGLLGLDALVSALSSLRVKGSK